MTTKKKLIKATGIVSIVYGIIAVLGGIAILSTSYWLSFVVRTEYWWNGSWWSTSTYWQFSGWLMAFWIIVGLMIIGVAITQIILGARVTKRISEPESSSTSCNGSLIAITILSAFVGGVVLLVLGIISLCLSDKDDEVSNNLPGAKPQSGVRELEQICARLKMYKDDGIITDEVYKQKVEEAVKKCLLDEK
ncbi:MAG: hypothetical protein FWE45_05050 [Firmicutes bacterium]|nr:hypothetical protein [Bacillota bacterium]